MWFIKQLSLKMDYHMSRNVSEVFAVPFLRVKIIH
jgi:hypothetical protein